VPSLQSHNFDQINTLLRPHIPLSETAVTASRRS